MFNTSFINSLLICKLRLSQKLSAKKFLTLITYMVGIREVRALIAIMASLIPGVSQVFQIIYKENKMHPFTYEMMMERGWRRCGTYYYKLDMARSCCKQWTLRQDITRFQIKKDQRKTVRKMLELAYECIELKA